MGKVEGRVGDGKIGGTDNDGAWVASEFRAQPVEHQNGQKRLQIGIRSDLGRFGIGVLDTTSI